MAKLRQVNVMAPVRPRAHWRGSDARVSSCSAGKSPKEWARESGHIAHHDFDDVPMVSVGSLGRRQDPTADRRIAAAN